MIHAFIFHWPLAKVNSVLAVCGSMDKQ